MVIGILGENCAGKSTLADAIRDKLSAEVITGKDYLRLAKSEAEATALFKEKLAQTPDDKTVVYVISEKEQLSLLPETAVRVLVKADLDTIKERFRARMRGNLPAPVAQMLERKHGMFDSERHDLIYDGVTGDPNAVCEALKAYRGISIKAE